MSRIKILLFVASLLLVSCASKKIVTDSALKANTTVKPEKNMGAEAIALQKLNCVQKVSDTKVYAENIVGDMLVKHFGFIQPDKVKSHIHLLDLLNFGDYDNCVDCPKSYELNGKIHCTYDECGKREILKEEFE